MGGADLENLRPIIGNELALKAGVRQYRAREIAGLVQHGDREVRLAAADLSFTSSPNDQLVIGGKTHQVVSVNTRSPFNEAAIHSVQVRGGNGNQRSSRQRPCGGGTACLWVRHPPSL
jgi:hypothetical protein